MTQVSEKVKRQKKKKISYELLLWVSQSYEQTLNAQLLCSRKWVPGPRIALNPHQCVHLSPASSTFWCSQDPSFPVLLWICESCFRPTSYKSASSLSWSQCPDSKEGTGTLALLLKPGSLSFPSEWEVRLTSTTLLLPVTSLECSWLWDPQNSGPVRKSGIFFSVGRRCHLKTLSRDVIHKEWHVRHLTGKRIENMLRGWKSRLEVGQWWKHKEGNGLRWI